MARPQTVRNASDGFSVFDDVEHEGLVHLRRRLGRAVQRICPPWLSSQRDDILQQSLIRVLQVSAPERTDAISSSYLWRVVFSVTVDEIRRQRRRREDALEVAQDNELALAAPSPEASAMAGQMGRAIHDCLGGLSEDRRVAVTLHLQGHSVPEAGRLVGWAVKRTANLTYRGLEDLRRCLSSKGFQP